MKYPVPLLPLLCLVAPLFAQDIHPGPLVWINCEDNPDELPVAKGVPKMDIPDDLKKVHEPVYAEFRLHITEKGQASVWDIGITSPWMPNSVLTPLGNFIAAKRHGKAVPCEVALQLIYNPIEADPNSPDAIPRLLAVIPPLSPEHGYPSGAKDPVIRVKATVDEKGAVTACHALSEGPAGFAEAAAGIVRSWQFAPARKSGLPITSDLELNVVFQSPLCRRDGIQVNWPKPLDRVAPAYPSYLKQAGFVGEVEVTFLVNVEGRVSEVFASKSNHPAFEEAAIASVKQWRFIPANIGGRPVSTQCVQLMMFQLGDSPSMGYEVKPPKTFPKGLPEDFQYDTGPKLQHLAVPVYPLEDLKAKRGGKVTLAYSVSPDGRVDMVKVLPGAPSPSIAAAAVAALEQFQFTPPGRKGKPCHALMRTELEFSPDGMAGHVPVLEATKRALHLLEKTPDKLTKAAALDIRPRLRVGSPPKISPANPARGKAIIEFVLDHDGLPQLPHILSADDESLGYAACQVVADWRFTRPQSRGKYVDTLVQIPIEFK